MRKAAFDHAWEKIRAPVRPHLSLSSIEAGLGGEILPITSRVTSFIGPNGAGKTCLLKTLVQAFESVWPNHARAGIQAISGSFRGSNFRIAQDSIPPRNIKAELIDASLQVHIIKQYLDSQPDIEDLLRQYEPNRPNVEQFGLYRHVSGKPYSKFSIIELEAPTVPTVSDAVADADEVLYPFFIVEVDGVSYDSRTMGFGEYCACYLIWKLHASKKGSVILLDEPDSHLSPASKRALIDAIALLAEDNEMWVAFTTHSPESLEALLESEIFIVSPADAGQPARLTPLVQRRQVLRSLGLAQPRRLLIAVEDVDSLAAVNCALNLWGAKSHRRLMCK